MENYLKYLDNPLVVIGLTIIIIVFLLTQKGIIGVWLRNYLKLSTDSEVVKYVSHINKKATKKSTKNSNLIREEFNTWRSGNLLKK